MIILNTHIKPANRKEAFKIVQSLLKKDDLKDSDLESLYKYFMPAIPKKAKQPWQWVAKAVGNKDVRYYLNYLYSDGARLIGCDGHRLHLIETDLEKGFYDPKTLDRVNVDAKYPDIDRLIKKPTKSDFETIKKDELKELAIKVNDNFTMNCFDIGKIETRVQKSYLLEAFNNQEQLEIATFNDDKSTIQGMNDFGFFLIMPMKK